MSLEDPFFVVRSEVEKSMSNVRQLKTKWDSLLNNPSTAGREEYNLTTSELRNSIRSIEWDLEDLDETIQIVESNQRKFNLDPPEIENRKGFVRQTKQSLNEIKVSVNSPSVKTKIQSSTRQALVGSNRPSSSKYSRLDREIERSNQEFMDDQQQQQQLLMGEQDDQIHMVGQSVGVLKTMSQRIGDELDEQNVLIDDLGHDIEMTDSRLQQTLQKIEKVLRLSDDKKQTYVLIGLIIVMVVIVVLFITI